MDTLIAILIVIAVVVAFALAFVVIRHRQRSGSVLAAPSGSRDPEVRP